MIREQPQTLSEEYLIEHGSLFDEDTFAFESYWENDKNHYEQLFDKPMDQGGKPFNGLVYERYLTGELLRYTFYQNGYHYGDDVEFYQSGRIRRFSRYTDSENYICYWYQDGIIKKIKDNHRSDAPDYYRTIEFDEKGFPQKQSILCEISFTYDHLSPDKTYHVEWYDNGEFRKITKLSPTSETLYTEIEFDPQGYPIAFEINPCYCPEAYSAQNMDRFYHINRFNQEYHFEKEILYKHASAGGTLLKYSGRLAFPYFNGTVEKIMEYRNGVPCGPQYLYYPDGQLKECYCISKGKEYHYHIDWYKHGMIKKILIYSKDGLRIDQIEFDRNGRSTNKVQIRRR